MILVAKDDIPIITEPAVTAVDEPKEGEFIQLVECSLKEFMTMAESGEPILLSDIGFFALARRKLGDRLGLG